MLDTLHEYVSAADPYMTPISALTLETPSTDTTDIHLFRTHDELPYPATSPNLLAAFVTIRPGDSIKCDANATSHIFYAIQGSGTCVTNETQPISFLKGDLFVVPSTSVTFTSNSNTPVVLYWVNDSPLLEYLRVTPMPPNFQLIRVPNNTLMKFVEQIDRDVGKNRFGVLIGNTITNPRPQGSGTLTASNTLWALLNVLPSHSSQKPHRHNSVALDLCVSGGSEKVYTLMGKNVDEEGNIIDPIRCVWKTGAVFITPPGYWHSHHNESDSDAFVLPVQDAGLYTYQRTLDIQFIHGETP